MIIEVFNRVEKKYKVAQQDFNAILKVIKQHMDADPYNQDDKPYPITNLYYDTTDRYLIRSSLMKPIYKEKLRVRVYGDYQEINSETKVFVEIKKKFNKIVNKRRSIMTLQEAKEFLNTHEIPKPQPYHNQQVLKEIQAMLIQHLLVPSLYLSYERLAYFSQSDPGLRISFDTNIRSQQSNPDLESSYQGELLLDTDTWLMEIKTGSAFPTWLTQLLTKYQIFPTSFSKYGEQHKQACQYRQITTQVKEERTCLNQFLPQLMNHPQFQ